MCGCREAGKVATTLVQAGEAEACAGPAGMEMQKAMGWGAAGGQLPHPSALQTTGQGPALAEWALRGATTS